MADHKRRMNGGEAMIRAAMANGINTVFGIPVVLEMCWDTMAKEWEVDVGQGYQTFDPAEPDDNQIGKAVKFLKGAKNVMIMVGGGAQHASAEVLNLAELLNAPVTAFRSRRGIVSEDHDVIREVLPRDGYFVEEICQVGFTSYFGFPVYKPRTYVTSGFQGTLGFGLPTALGVKVAAPNKAVVSVTGDGGFMYCMPELATAVQHNIGVITIVFNNNAFGNVRRDQLTLFDGHLIGADLVNPDFVKLADSFGVKTYRVRVPDELRPALSKAIDEDAPALIEVVCQRGSEASPWEFLIG